MLITDAGLSPQLLREILYILEQHTYFQTTSGRYVDTTYFGQGLMAIHARQVGERAIDLGDYFNVTNLIGPTLGWPERDSFLTSSDHRRNPPSQLAPLEPNEYWSRERRSPLRPERAREGPDISFI